MSAVQAWLKPCNSSARSWLEKGLDLKKNQALLQHAVIELAAALLEEVIEQQCRTITVEAGPSSVQRRVQSPADTKAQLYALNRPRRLVNQPLERGAKSFSRPLP